MSLLPAMRMLKPHERLPFLALTEQQLRREADLPMLRALKDYRKMLGEGPTRHAMPIQYEKET